jgi:hypothetical protein
MMLIISPGTGADAGERRTQACPVPTGCSMRRAMGPPRRASCHKIASVVGTDARQDAPREAFGDTPQWPSLPGQDRLRLCAWFRGKPSASSLSAVPEPAAGPRAEPLLNIRRCGRDDLPGSRTCTGGERRHRTGDSRAHRAHDFFRSWSTNFGTSFCHLGGHQKAGGTENAVSKVG